MYEPFLLNFFRICIMKYFFSTLYFKYSLQKSEIMKTNYLTLIILVCSITCINAQQSGNCINADFELADFSHWTGSTGSCCPVNTNIPGIVPGRHTIMSGPGDDPNSSGYIPLVPPGGGNYTARLGNSNVGA